MSHTCNTIDGVLAYIRENSKPGDWRFELLLTSRQGVRFAAPIKTSCSLPCPICWVATVLGLNPTNCCIAFQQVAPALGLSPEDAVRLVHAADDFQEPELRARLLEACHLSKEISA